MTHNIVTAYIMQSNLVSKDAHDSIKYKSEAMGWFFNVIVKIAETNLHEP